MREEVEFGNERSANLTWPRYSGAGEGVRKFLGYALQPWVDHLDLAYTPFTPPFRCSTRPLPTPGACFHAMRPLLRIPRKPSHQDGFVVWVETALPGTTADPKTAASGGRSEERPVGAVGVTICSPCLLNPWRLHFSRNPPSSQLLA